MRWRCPGRHRTRPQRRSLPNTSSPTRVWPRCARPDWPPYGRATSARARRRGSSSPRRSHDRPLAPAHRDRHCRELRDAILLTVITATASTLAAVALGTPLAWWLARHHFRGRSLVDAVLDLP